MGKPKEKQCFCGALRTIECVCGKPECDTCGNALCLVLARAYGEYTNGKLTINKEGRDKLCVILDRTTVLQG